MDEAAIASHLAEVSTTVKSHEHRIADVEKRCDENEKLVAAMTELKTDFGNTKRDVAEIKSDVKTLTMKPAKRWESVVDKVLMTIIGVILGVVIAKIGLG